MIDDIVNSLSRDEKREFKELRLPQDKKINPERLDDELREALGEKYISMDTGAGIVVRAADNSTKEDADLVEQIVQQHDPTKISKAEQKRADHAAAQERLKALDLSGEVDMKLLVQAIDDIRKIVLHDG
jgi:hypothetical protein